MILRAAFSIAFVALFIPHEPDLGYGRPGGFLPTGMSARLPTAAQFCGEGQTACGAGLALADNFRGTILSNLDRVKAELKQSEQARSEHGRNLGLAARIMDY